ncbi:tetratricopeptide repeat protein 7B-like [Drosophila miranda]|uniref:tetratricopeptide repeat protein 7B-like n=1 Tax=Drosophila miranda TaxID=7229 RepID=UPI00143F0E2B|nr:tetratricopeptide repeat protein 7B-like [Drosophila miranda]
MLWLEHALSEAASSLSSFTQRPGPRRPCMLQIEIWLLLADVYLRIEQPNEALNCNHEASPIYPLSHQIMYMRGQVHVYLEQWRDAKQCYLNAVAANPNHTEALRALGETHFPGWPRRCSRMRPNWIQIVPEFGLLWARLWNPWGISMRRRIALPHRCSWSHRARCCHLPRFPWSLSRERSSDPLVSLRFVL